MEPKPGLVLSLTKLPWLRQGIKLAIDFGCAMASWELGGWMLGSAQGLWGGVEWALISISIHITFRLSRQHYRFVSFGDLLQLASAGGMLLLLALPLHHLSGAHAPQPAQWVLAVLMTVAGWSLVRIFARGVVESHPFARKARGRRTLVVGAGYAGSMVVQELRRHPELGCEVVGFIDDDLAKQGLRIHGVPVLGPQDLMEAIAGGHAVTQVVLAIPSASGQQIRRITERTKAIGLDVKTVPGIFDLLGQLSWKPELRGIEIEDLLRREPVRLDQDALQEAIRDQTILITGGGGSIGCEIARQVCRFHPARIVLLGRGEHSLWTAEQAIREAFPSQPIALELCDIRHRRRLEQVFGAWKPGVVFHAAAHKHVPYLERHPEEAVENNIFGTKQVLDASIRHRVAHFVNISTDKAVNPTNILGVTKRIAEYLVADAANRVQHGERYVTVRFGNVLGSRGSVLPIFQSQIRKGGPVMVTHPEMTRYFMTVPEASQLVLQSGLLGKSGHVYVLDMGQPIRIMDLAEDLIRLSGLVPGQDIDIQIMGIRPGEKLFEELFYGQDARPSAVHPKVHEVGLVCPSRIGLEEGLQGLRRAVLARGPEHARTLLHYFQEMVPTYAPSPNGFGKFLQEENPR